MEKLLFSLLDRPNQLQWHLGVHDDGVDGRFKVIEKWDVTLCGGLEFIKRHRDRLADDLGCPVYVRLVESRTISVDRDI